LSAVLHSIDALFGLVSESKSLLDQTPLHEQPFRQLRVWNNDMLEFVDTIRSCNTHQRRITDDILVLSKLDSELFLISPTVFHLETFVRQIEKTFGPEAREAKIDFTVSIDDSAQSLGIEWVKADPGRFMQVLTSLVANAIKFTRDQNGPREIDIRLGAGSSTDLPVFINLNMVEDTTCEDSTDKTLREDELYLWCSVKDTGCGMDTKERTRILSQFRQASPKTYNRYGGSGFGLVVSRKLVKLQAGRIGFISNQGAGSTFVFSAKATRASSNELQLSREVEKKLSSAAHRSKPSLIGPTEKPPQYNILLVEDNLINQKVLKKSLLRHGFSVQVSNNGLEAITFLKTTKCWNSCNMPSETQPAVDLILMDIEMPVMDGLECTKAIRAAQSDGTVGRHIPIVAVTANARPAQLEAALNAGMDDTIVKPFRITDLEPILHRFLAI
jgi:CheY-like chemotaxis protein